MSEYIYLLQEREFIKSNEPIFKVGKTKQENLKRIQNYPNGTKLICQFSCENCDILERKIIENFKNKYELQKDIGNEYFKGDSTEMMKDIFKIIDDNLQVNSGSDSDCENNSIIEIQADIAEEVLGSDNDCEIINTYEKFMKHTTIEKIIITNKTRQEGFLKFKNSCWYKIWDKNSIDENAEILYDWLKENSNEGYIENKNWQMCKFKYEDIITDICKKCYYNPVDIYQLKYNEFVITNNNKCKILDTKNFQLKNCDDDIKDNKFKLFDGRISMGKRALYLSEEINTTIVGSILSSLIDYKILYQFKKFCYNIFVENTSIQVFQDYTTNYRCHLLSNWITDTLYSICGNGHPSGYICYIDHWKNESYYKKIFKKEQPRLVIIDNIFIQNGNKYEYNESQLTKIIDFVKKCGIKNILVKHYIQHCHYDYKKYIEYIVEHKIDIQPLFSNKNYQYPDLDIDYETNMGSYDDIFYLTDMLFHNFLKWCCTMTMD